MITQELLKEFLHYDPETGIFTWLKTVSRSCIGQIAGTIVPKGYRRIGLNKKPYAAHRLAFFYMIGSFPPDQIDHINGIKDDNRWVNLREATCYQNMHNQGKQIINKSGYKGVFWHKRDKKWHAKINHMNRKIYLGGFDTPEIAHKAYIAAATKLHREFANFG